MSKIPVFEGQIFSTAEVCELLDISKSTLYRWEDEDWFPVVERDMKGQREYTAEHIRAIAEKQIENVRDKLSSCMERGDDNGVYRLWQGANEQISLRKFYDGDLLGLRELEEYPQVSSKIISDLLRIAITHYEPDDHVFCDIIRVVSKHVCT